MIYKQFKPHAALWQYIDAFWTIDAGKVDTAHHKVLPDGCIDIIMNLGEDCKTDNLILQNEKAYLVGTMLHYKMVDMQPGAKLLGVRFKPAAFLSFYSFASLHEVTDGTVEFDKKLSPGLKGIMTDPVEYLNQFFLNRLKPPKYNLLPVIEDIKDHRGQINVRELARRHFTTVRQLERYFKMYVGTGPKEFINFLRYQFVAPVIKSRLTERSLADIAFDYGYYDHAHLANEVKRYAGVAPSQL